MKTISLKLVDVTEDCVGPLISMIDKVGSITWVESAPDYIIHSCFGHDVLRYDGVRICWLGENVVPDFNICDYAMGFNRLSFGDRYRRIPLYRWYREYEELFDESKHVIPVHGAEELRRKTRFCTVVVTNGLNRDPYLERLMDSVSQYRQVDSGGKWRNNVGGAVKDKIGFVRQGKFSLICENSSTPGYVTEKILHAVVARSIPVYWGAEDIGEDFNPAAFINCHKYASPDEVREYIKWLDTHDEEYCRILEQPCFAGGKEPSDLSSESILKWISHIFDQPKESAYRRNRFYWGKRYQRDLATAYFNPPLQALRLARKKLLRLRDGL